MLAAERNVQHLTKNAPAAANDRNEFRWFAKGQMLTTSLRLVDPLSPGADIHCQHHGLVPVQLSH